MRTAIESFDDQFLSLHRRSMDVLNTIPPPYLFRRDDSGWEMSCADHIVRSAAVVEQTFGGITTRLWDNPFEWTLREYLSSVDRLTSYLVEVEDRRQIGFRYLSDDSVLEKKIPAPLKLTTLADLLSTTLDKASDNLTNALDRYDLLFLKSKIG